MRFCTQCGSMIEDTAKFCPNCGFAVDYPQQAQQPVQQQTYQQPYQPYAQRADDKYQGFSMNWYKFLVYFALWAGAVANLFSAIQIVTGANYEGNADVVYRMFPAMHAGDIIAGILVFGVAALGILTAIKLLKLSAAGPKLLLGVYAMNLLVQIFYVVFTLVATEGMLRVFDVLTPTVIASLGVSLAMIAINRIYFKKRESIFVN